MNKSLIKRRFTRSLNTYNKTATVQQDMADVLLGLLPEEKYDSILEIGCGTGFLTKKIKNKISYNTYSANDVVEECKNFIRMIDEDIEFLAGDIHTVNLDKKYDLIISNAVFQWFSKQDDILQKLKNQLQPNGIIAFSSFGEKNFYELKEIFDIGLNYANFVTPVKEDIIELKFDSLLSLLKHIQQTGVNAITSYSLTKGSLKELETKFLKKYGAIKLTYHPTYFII